MIPKAENTSKHKDQSNQSDAINDTTSDSVRAIKAIKAMQSKRSKRCNQSDTINDTARAMRSKRYDQRYNQDKPGSGNGYTASSTYAKAKDPSKA